MLPVRERRFMVGEDADPPKPAAPKAAAAAKPDPKATPAAKGGKKDAKAKGKNAAKAAPKPEPGSEEAWNLKVKACEKDLRAKGCPAEHCNDLKKYPTFAERAVCTDDAKRWKPPPCKFTTSLYIRMADMDLDPAFALKPLEKRAAIKLKILVKAVKSHKAAADLNKNGKIEPKELKHLIDKLSPMIKDNSQLGKCTYTKVAPK